MRERLAGSSTPLTNEHMGIDARTTLLTGLVDTKEGVNKALETIQSQD